MKDLTKQKKSAPWIVVAAVLLCAALAGCAAPSPGEASSDADETKAQTSAETDQNEIIVSDDAEVWTLLEDSSWALEPTLLIDRRNGTYQLTLNEISNYIGLGRFEETDDALILDDGQMRFVFKKAGDVLEYDESASYSYTYEAFSDGAIFRRISP